MVLLDTYTLIALTAQQENLSQPAKQTISNNAGRIFVSAATALEIGQEHSKKLLELPLPPETWFNKALSLHGLTELPINNKIALKATQLPQIHDDQVDRLLIASAITKNLTLITPNKNIQLYPDLHWIW